MKPTQISLFQNFQNTKKTPKPFIKWAGGKSQLLDQFTPLFPKQFNNYFEPFTGSAAVFFYLYTLRETGTISFKNARLTDLNDELILVYKTVRDNVDELISLLASHRQSHNKEYYYHVRSVKPETLSDTERAARFIYLNKTCFNGLYRVNRSGQFNVPMGSYKNPQIFNEGELRSASESLRGVDLAVANYADVLLHAKSGDFFYFDPPYLPISKTSYFTGYTKYPFAEKEQQELKDVFLQLDKSGCKVMLSNSWADLILDLYRDYNLIEVKASRAINSDAEKRGKISELVVINYDK